MADKVTRQYNLRSKEELVTLPVQLQLSDDGRFMSDLLAKEGAHTGQVSDSGSSINDSDCEDLIHSSPVKHSPSDKPGSSVGSDPTVSDSHVSQQVINMQILSHLQALGKRLDSMEAKNCKKTSDPSKTKTKPVKKVKQSETPVTVAPEVKNSLQIPDLNMLRQDALIQLKVEQRLKEIQEADKPGKIKSSRGGSVEVLVKNKVKWPHEYILSGSSKERISYDHLSTVQWVAGFCRIMKEETNSNVKDCMLDYLVALLDDAQDFSWEVAKASHAVLLCRMEQGEVESYADVQKIDRIRRANAQRHLPYSGNSYKKSQGKVQKVLPCNYFNQGTCSQSKTHDNRGVRYTHVCSSCFANGKNFPHPETECKNKAKKFYSPKND